MTKLTQGQLIDQIKTLKDIKPRKEWAVLLKSQILAEKNNGMEIIGQSAKFVGFSNIFVNIFSPRKLAYSLSVILFLVIGVLGFARYTVPGDLLFPVKKISEQSQAALSGQTSLKQDVAILNNRINDLAQVSRDGRTGNIPSTIAEIKTNASELTKSLKKNSVNDPQTIKDIASSLKTLSDVPGTDLTTNSDVKDLYQAVVQNQVSDLKKETLNDSQKNILAQAENLYEQGKYSEALEKILLIGK